MTDIITQGNIAHGFWGQGGVLPVGLFQPMEVRQVHSPICVYRGLDDVGGDRTQADAMVTDQPGLGLVIVTADCVPILLHGTTTDGQPVIGAAHAGWRGALSGVIENTVDMMTARGAGRATIKATIGPCIRQPSYEVSPGFEAPFLADDVGSARFFKNDGKLWFDLSGYVQHRLARAGVSGVMDDGVDTYDPANGFHSYRLRTQQGLSTEGRNLSCIWVAG